MFRTLTAASAIGLAGLTAQNPCEGNGFGSAYVTATPAMIGGTLRITLGSPATPNAAAVLSLSGSFGPVFHPAVGTVCMDFTNPAYLFLLVFLDATGNHQLNINLPPDPAFFGFAPLFANGLTFEGGTFSISKTVRVQFEYPESWREGPAMNEARALHTATAFEASARDNRTGVLVAGGGQGSLILPVPSAFTEVYDSLTRTWRPGPTMAVARTAHRAVRLMDGRILIAGGMVPAGPPATGGPATTHCEVYDPATNTFAPTGAMQVPRMAHALTQLADGRVFCSGGLTDWTNAGPNFRARCDSATTTTELWDPQTGQWTLGPTMASRRAGHTQTMLFDGRLLLVGGVNGGSVITHPLGQSAIPTFTNSCELFDLGTGLLATGPSLLLARGFHGAGVLPNGQVLVTGGAASIGQYGEAASTNDCVVYDPVTNIWGSTGGLFAAVAFHAQVSHPRTGAALLLGGFTGNFNNLQGINGVQSHDGVSATLLATMGSNPGVAQPSYEAGTHAACVMHDGTLLVTGGSTFTIPNARGLIYVPQ